jgi:iron complex transport system ATP-binding protein
MILQAEGVVAGYGAPVLHGVTCAVEPGSLLAVVGPNGSGKTTLLRALLGLLPAMAGRVTLDGRDLAGWSRRDVARAIGVVTQREDPAFPLPVEEAVLFGRYPHLGPLAAPRAADRAAVERAMERADVTALRGRPTDHLSGGEAQRVRLARALAQEPALLVLDEPTTSLDVRHEMQLFELVRGLADQGLGALVVTHHLNLAARFADRMLLLDEGRSVGRGTPTEVLTEEIISRVFAWPVALTTWCDGSPQVVPLRPSEVLPARTAAPPRG